MTKTHEALVAMRKRTRAGQRAAGVAFALFCLSSSVGQMPGFAAPGPLARAEIDHLLDFILQSPCRFVRNGREYGSERAHRHVIRKFEHFEDEIVTAEDFIELSATRSTMSGQPYRFVCDGVARPSADVLRDELARYRAALR